MERTRFLLYGDIDLNLIEGLGGVMAPIGEKHTILDLIDATGARALLVVGSYLGTLSHSLTAITALATRGIELAAIVICQSETEPVATAETATTLSRFSGPAPILTMPRRKDASAAELAALIEASVNEA